MCIRGNFFEYQSKINGIYQKNDYNGNKESLATFTSKNYDIVTQYVYIF